MIPVEDWARRSAKIRRPAATNTNPAMTSRPRAKAAQTDFSAVRIAPIIAVRRVPWLQEV
jgi:hypothetical protein